ncbi:MAG: glycosyltransferase family 2 protein [Chthoniobacterales bacterium]
MKYLEQISSSNDKIIGIVLVRNEDRFIEQVVKNITEFCDHVFLVDHASSDNTVSILQRLESQYPGKFSLHQITDPRESQEFLKPFIGTKTWVFGVDGDELYDPEGLTLFRKHLMAGLFDDYWMILGNVIHCNQLNLAAGTASGYATPPSRSITKLYNFSAIVSWDGETPERLHGGTLQFRSGFHEQKKRSLQHEYSWDNALLRCLHLCFIPRSSSESSAMRQNIMETLAGGTIRRLCRRTKIFLQKIFHQPIASTWKQKHYARGDSLCVNAKPFFK